MFNFHVNKLFNNLNTPLFTTMIVYVASFLATMVFSHILGAELMGEYYLFLSYYTFFAFLSGNTMEYVVANVTKRDDVEQMNRVYSVAFILRMLMTLITVLIILAVHPAHMEWMIIAVLLAVALGTIMSSVHSENRIGTKFIISVTNDIVKLILQVVLVVLGFQVAGMIGAVIIGLICSITLGLTQKNLTMSFKMTWDAFKSNAKMLMPFYFALAIYMGAYIVVNSCSPMFLDLYCDSADIGQFRSAWNIASVGALFITAVTPMIIRQGKDMTKEKISHMIFLCTLCTVPIVCGGIALSEWLLYFCFGSDFSAGYLCLILLLAFKLFENVGEICLATVMYAYSKRAATIFMLVSCSLMVGLNFALIPFLGIEGSCIAHLIAITLGMLIMSVIFLKKHDLLKIDVKNSSKLLFSGLVMGVIVFGLSLILGKSLFACLGLVILGGVIYVGLVRLMAWKQVKESYRLISKL